MASGLGVARASRLPALSFPFAAAGISAVAVSQRLDEIGPRYAGGFGHPFHRKPPGHAENSPRPCAASTRPGGWGRRREAGQRPRPSCRGVVASARLTEQRIRVVGSFRWLEDLSKATGRADLLVIRCAADHVVAEQE